MYCLSSGKKAEGTRWLVMWRKSKPYPKGRGEPCWLSLPLCVIPASLIPSQGPRRHPQARCRIFPLPLPVSSQHIVCILGELVPSLGRILLVSPHLGACWKPCTAIPQVSWLDMLLLPYKVILRRVPGDGWVASCPMMSTGAVHAHTPVAGVSPPRCAPCHRRCSRSAGRAPAQPSGFKDRGGFSAPSSPGRRGTGKARLGAGREAGAHLPLL